MPLFWIIYSIPHIIQGKVVWGVIDIILGVSGLIILGWESKRQVKRFYISDKDILEQIKIHKEWNSNKS